MLIDIPVTISFDIDGDKVEGFNFRRKAAGQRVFTMRYDTEDTDKPAEWCIGYPPKGPSAHFTVDKQGVLFDLLSGDADKAIAKRAEADPETYDAVERPR